VRRRYPAQQICSLGPRGPSILIPVARDPVLGCPSASIYPGRKRNVAEGGRESLTESLAPGEPGCANIGWTGDGPLFLHNLWYFALASHRLKKGRTVVKRMLDVPLLIGRDRDGHAFALRNVCRHQGMPLSCGRFDGRHIECANHGWRYDTTGALVTIPSLAADSSVDLRRLTLRQYPCRESQGLLWVYLGETTDDLPPVPEIPGVGARSPEIVDTLVFRCDMDRAALGLIDPAHGPYVHRSWFWRSGRDPREKARRFVPTHLGFTMERHTPTRNTRAFRFLPGGTDIEISFQLPGVHMEHLRLGRHAISGMIAVTPITARQTEVSYCLYWTIPWLHVLRPLIKHFTHAFFEQDRRVTDRIAEIRVEKPPLALIGDPDVQALWYFQLKKEFLQARAEERAFRNPVVETTLRWKT